MTRVLIIDDHPVFRRGLAFLLSTSGHEVVGEAASGAEVLEAVRAHRPDLVILDLGLPELHGSAVAGRLRAESPQVKIIVVTMYDDNASIERALDAGVDGYVLKDAAPEQILAAIDAAMAGARILGSGVRIQAPTTSHRDETAKRYRLTARESDVADLLRHGLGNQAIGERLGISEKTIANYVANIRVKLDATSRYDAARKLREELPCAGPPTI
ncbi:DNA-binding NarL/FixJ family response regulator [Microbacterium terrae]|uniref:Response regulator protein VraR n=1 Tax=Microbacterium terrae TaxID=69369 RepID=A0A0M2H4Q9_9MICO|nr:response regulator transcription factor [Microbacterium terrae]KJL38727.1 Response regulator protein VraR [Microbacterium terrae]MBP1076146.1 DNA-binding NarL/FixJ family response regulator [Microbacterium terrae]GLJ96966.1 DNA-binding response regulator [Microbacterium terrae]